MSRDPFEPRGGYASVPEKDKKKYEIRVGNKVYPMSRWREGILFYLFGIWSGDKQFWKNPEIRFGDLRLILKTDDCRVLEELSGFHIQGNAPDKPGCSYFGNYSLDVGASRLEVMDALVRFAKDPYLGRVGICLGETTVAFYQKERRGEYGCYMS